MPASYSGTISMHKPHFGAEPTIAIINVAPQPFSRVENHAGEAITSLYLRCAMMASQNTMSTTYVSPLRALLFESEPTRNS
jgi:hypothetical protein